MWLGPRIYFTADSDDDSDLPDLACPLDMLPEPAVLFAALSPLSGLRDPTEAALKGWYPRQALLCSPTGLGPTSGDLGEIGESPALFDGPGRHGSTSNTSSEASQATIKSAKLFSFARSFR